MAPLRIPCGSRTISVYEKTRRRGDENQIFYRAAFTVHRPRTKGSAKLKSKREWGTWSASITGTLAVLLPKLKMMPTDIDAVWAEVSRCNEIEQPAMSHTPQIGTLPPAVVFFKKNPFEGIVRTYTRKEDTKVRMKLSRFDAEGRRHAPLLESNWHATSEEAFGCIQDKCKHMGRDVPAMSHKRCDEPGVKFVHQIFGLFRDGKEMNALFELSSSAWRAYANRHRCVYIFWTADMCDTLIQLHAPQWLRDLYFGVSFSVQRVDVVRFFILFLYGGIYADLDVFPNLAMFPQVSLGLCKMSARETKTMCSPPEWEMEVIVATAGNEFLMEILKGMLRNIRTLHSDKPWRLSPRLDKYYSDKPCRFIYQTTGPKGVGKTLRLNGYEPHVTVFSMNRPVQNLEKHLSLDSEGRVRCHLPGMEQYDVWSAFSMSYNVKSQGKPPPLAEPLAQLLPFPAIKKRIRYIVKTTPPADSDIDGEGLAGCETPYSDIDEQSLGCGTDSDVEMELGHISPEAQAALENVAYLFLSERKKNETISAGFAFLRSRTRECIRSIHKRRV